MHAGCPVIASDRGSLPEVVGAAGLLQPPDDAAAWADALEIVLVDEATRAALAQAGREQARQFTWEKTAAATLALYRQP
jgi:glycosyltransferase involved in cell wall biosynthesis